VEVWVLEFPILSSYIGNHLSHRVLGELADGGFVFVSTEEIRNEEKGGILDFAVRVLMPSTRANQCFIGEHSL